MQNYKGFTLLELMVTMAVAAILMAVAVPASRDMQANMRVNSVTSDFVSVLKAARTQAQVSRRHATVAPIDAGDWGGSGWQVTEQIQAAAQQNNVTVTVFERHDVPAAITITSVPASVTSFRFEGATGMAQNANGTPLTVTSGAVTFRVCDGLSGSRDRGRDIQMNQFGRVIVIKHADTLTCNP